MLMTLMTVPGTAIITLWWYFIGSQVDELTITTMFIKTPKHIFSYGVSQYNKKSASTISDNVSETPESVSHHQNICNEVESQLYGKFSTEPIKGGSIYMLGKLKK